MQINVFEEKYTEVAVLIQITGEIEATQAEELAKTFEKYMQRGNNRFVLDLHDVTYMDSSGIGVLVKMFMQLKKKEGELVFRRISKNVDHILAMNGLKDLFNIG